jgi:7,8-didemethyl-8-hydroxy-5-deazariboflavin synthase CofG subunit
LGDQLGCEAVREELLEGAFEVKRRGKGDLVSVSKNVFIPLTNLCRNRCGYCSFSEPADSPEARIYTLEEVAEAARGGLRTGCHEALVCLGDKPEAAYPSYREWLAQRGLATTVEYLVQACRVAFEGGMLPHTNAGVLSAEQMEALRPWNASMGLMLTRTPPCACACTRRRARSAWPSPAVSCSGSGRPPRSGSTRCSRSATWRIAAGTSRR